MVQLLGNFGCEEERYHPVTIGMNDKGGMDGEEYENYILNIMYNIFTGVADKPGKRVLINIGSGPGRTNTNLLARLRL